MLVGLGKHCSWKIGFREDKRGGTAKQFSYVFPCTLLSIIYFLVCTYCNVYNTSVSLLHCPVSVTKMLKGTKFCSF